MPNKQPNYFLTLLREWKETSDCNHYQHSKQESGAAPLKGCPIIKDKTRKWKLKSQALVNRKCKNHVHPTCVILYCKETTDVQVSEGADEQRKHLILSFESAINHSTKGS